MIITRIFVDALTAGQLEDPSSLLVTYVHAGKLGIGVQDRLVTQNQHHRWCDHVLHVSIASNGGIGAIYGSIACSRTKQWSISLDARNGQNNLTLNPSKPALSFSLTIVRYISCMEPCVLRDSTCKKSNNVKVAQVFGSAWVAGYSRRRSNWIWCGSAPGHPQNIKEMGCCPVVCITVKSTCPALGNMQSPPLWPSCITSPRSLRPTFRKNDLSKN